MRTQRERQIVRGLFFASIGVGGVFFVILLCILTLIGLQAGFLKLRVFGPPPHPRDWAETIWSVVMWGGSSCIAMLSAWGLFRFGKKRFL